MLYVYNRMVDTNAASSFQFLLFSPHRNFPSWSLKKQCRTTNASEMTTANSDEERMLQELIPPLEISETFVEEEDTFAKQKSQCNESGESSFLDFSLKSPLKSSFPRLNTP